MVPLSVTSSGEVPLSVTSSGGMTAPWRPPGALTRLLTGLGNDQSFAYEEKAPTPTRGRGGVGNWQGHGPIAICPPWAYVCALNRAVSVAKGHSMNWITNYVRPKINSLFSRREVPENLWTKCSECGTMLFHRELADNLNVCTNCDHHMAITPRERFAGLFDGGVFTEVAVPEPLADPLHFKDQKKYPERMKAAQKATGEKEAMLVVQGEVLRTPIVAVGLCLMWGPWTLGLAWPVAPKRSRRKRR